MKRDGSEGCGDEKMNQKKKRRKKRKGRIGRWRYAFVGGGPVRRHRTARSGMIEERDWREASRRDRVRVYRSWGSDLFEYSKACRVRAEMCSMGSMRMIREQTQTRQTKTEFEKAEKDSKKYKG